MKVWLIKWRGSTGKEYYLTDKDVLVLYDAMWEEVEVYFSPEEAQRQFKDAGMGEYFLEELCF